MATVNGTSGNDTLVGTTDADEINGLEGNDTISGLAGNDRLDGGEGDDTIDNTAGSGLGDDIVFGRGGNDTFGYVVGSSGTDLVDLGTGIDLVNVTGATGGGQIRLTFTSAEVGDGDSNDSGTQANQTGGLAVRFQTENGSDVLTGTISRFDDEGIVFAASAGTTFDVRDLPTGVARGDQFEVVTLGTQAGETLTSVQADRSYYINAGMGADTVLGGNVNDFLVGGAGDDIINGNAGDDGILGGGGADTIRGGTGIDIADGGAGDDVIFVENNLDVVREAANGGFDTVYSSVSYVLAADTSVEVLSTSDFNSANAINLTGNAGANRLFGNAGSNFLIGGGGVDFLSGRGGDDSYGVDDQADVVEELDGGGFDTVYSSVNYRLSDQSRVEVLSTADFGGSGAINLTGNASANSIFGNLGSNFLIGGGGADTLTGFDGDDSYGVDDQADVVRETIGGGFDTLYSSINYTLADDAFIEVLSTADFGATTATNLTGNVNANRLFGNAGANVLNGAGGNDVLTGFGGADTFAFTTALGNNNVDQITDFQSGSDRIQLSQQIFSALTAGPLLPGSFQTGAAATDADDRIIYDQTTGFLSYDADGSGAGVATQFARLQPGTTLNFSDFVVV